MSQLFFDLIWLHLSQPNRVVNANRLKVVLGLFQSKLFEISRCSLVNMCYKVEFSSHKAILARLYKDFFIQNLKVSWNLCFIKVRKQVTMYIVYNVNCMIIIHFFTCHVLTIIKQLHRFIRGTFHFYASNRLHAVKFLALQIMSTYIFLVNHK